MLDLPWPPKELNPNKRLHWTKKSKASRLYGAACYILAKSHNPPPGKLHLTITFCPPDRRRRDDDNIIAAFKAGRDGVAMAWNRDDSLFRPVTYQWGDIHKGGKVIISYESAE